MGGLILAGISPAEEVSFGFALPDLEGRISLGIFDDKGRLVRTLAMGATEKDFTIGLNGLIANWDGRTDAGEKAAAGAYFARGYVVGNAVKAEGMAYHFNDWIADEDSPRILSIRDFQRAEGGFVLAAGMAMNPGVASGVLRFSAASGWVWSLPLAGKAPHRMPLRSPAKMKATDGKYMGGDVVIPESEVPLIRGFVSKAHVAAGDGWVAAYANEQLCLMDFISGEMPFRNYCGAPTAMAIFDRKLFLASSGGLTRNTIPDLSSETPEATPFSVGALAISARGLLAGVWEKPGLWLQRDGSWKEIPLPVMALSLSWGAGETFWIIGRQDAELFAGQFDENGEFLREYKSDLEPKKIDASEEAEEITVLEEGAGRQRLRTLRLAEKKEDGVSDWEVVFEKSIEDCRDFGFVDGKLVADAGPVPQRGEFRLRAAGGGLLEKGKELVLCAKDEAAGLYLVTAEGLPLLRVARRAGSRIVLVPGDALGTLKIFAGDEAVVSEFLVSGLLEIAEFDAGRVDLP